MQVSLSLSKSGAPLGSQPAGEDGAACDLSVLGLLLGADDSAPPERQSPLFF